MIFSFVGYDCELNEPGRLRAIARAPGGRIPAGEAAGDVPNQVGGVLPRPTPTGGCSGTSDWSVTHKGIGWLFGSS